MVAFIQKLSLDLSMYKQMNMNEDTGRKFGTRPLKVEHLISRQYLLPPSP